VLILVFFRSQGDTDHPHPRVVCRSGAPVTTRRRSLRAPQVVASAAATGELPHDTVVATGPQQEKAAVAAAWVAATAVASASPALVPTAGDHAAVVDVADDDAPARVSPRAYVGDAGGWLRDVTALGARR
jgi:hypothetical protein